MSPKNFSGSAMDWSYIALYSSRDLQCASFAMSARGG